MEAPMTPTEKTIRDFLVEEILYDRQLADLGPEDLLLRGSLLDSMGILDTVTFCEQTFDIHIPEEELVPDHFENIRAIGQLVDRWRAQGSEELDNKS
jgi:acyl carrier protein